MNFCSLKRNEKQKEPRPLLNQSHRLVANDILTQLAKTGGSGGDCFTINTGCFFVFCPDNCQRYSSTPPPFWSIIGPKRGSKIL